jgi:hypothetical protein
VSKLPKAARVAIVAAVWSLGPLTVFLSNQPCSIATVFHRPCPGCGMTRATLLMLHGHVMDSFAMHPLVIPMLACLAMLVVLTLRATWRQGVPWVFFHEKIGRVAVYATAATYVALVALWALREFGYCGGRVPIIG